MQLAASNYPGDKWMNRDTRRRQQRQARLAKNAERAARRQASTPHTVQAVSASLERQAYGERLVDRVRDRWKALAAAVATLALIGFGIWFFVVRDTVDTSDLGVMTPEDQGQQHLNSGEVYAEYNTNPPTSGPHDPEPVPWGVYETGKTPFPTKENLVHNMEHGGVIVWYRPESLSAEQLDQLRRHAADWIRDQRKKVVVLPFTDLPDGTVVAATAWTRLMTLDSFDLDKIGRFVTAFEGPGPENVPFTGPVILPEGV
jgi:hypothetical protein